MSAVCDGPQLTSSEVVLALTSWTRVGAQGRSEDGQVRHETTLRPVERVKVQRETEDVLLTCLQIPEVLAAHLVVPGLPISISAAPDVESGVDGDAAVACSGSGDVLLHTVHQDRLPTH